MDRCARAEAETLLSHLAWVWHRVCYNRPNILRRGDGSLRGVFAAACCHARVPRVFEVLISMFGGTVFVWLCDKHGRECKQHEQHVKKENRLFSTCRAPVQWPWAAGPSPIGATLLYMYGLVVRYVLSMVWYGMVDVCDGYLAAEASG